MNPIDEPISRLTAWQRDYGEKCSPQFNHDLRALLAAAREQREAISVLRYQLSEIERALGCYGTPVDSLCCIAELQESVKRQEFLIASYAPAAEKLNDAYVESQQLAGTLSSALETVLTWLTNANAMPTNAMVANVFRALGAAGMSKEDLDKAAICLMRGAAPNTTLKPDDDGVREMLARHGVNYE